MATLSDRAVGFLMMAVALSVFTYYTAWVVVLPFVDDDHFLQRFFLPRYFATAIPIALGVLLLTLIGVFVSVVLIRDSFRRKEKLKAK